MNLRAFTPCFRWWERRFARPGPAGILEYPAPSSGNHAAEAAFLAVATGLLTATWAIPATAPLTSLFLRLPVLALLLFVVPQLLMAAVSLVSPWLAGPRFPREAAQDWSCLALMTLYAALHCRDSGWEAVICQGWLAFAALNALLCPGANPDLLAMLTVPRLATGLILLHLGAGLVAWQAGWLPGLLAMGTLHLWLLATTLWPGSTPFCPAVCRFPATERTVILTIDDGPCQDTAAFLDALLDCYDAKAVFFLIGRRAEADPTATGAITGRGHRVENHTLTHPAWTFWAYGPGRQRREIGETSALLARLTGQPPGWFRAPAGFRNPFTGAVLRETGLGCLGWTVRGFDTRESHPDKVLARLRRGFQPGAVLLIHQGHPHSLAVLESLLAALKAEGYRCILPPAGSA